MKLPNATQALIEPAKLHGYVLSPVHPIGRFKARYFATLGYTAENWTAFADALRTEHLPQDAKLIETTSYGRKYEIRAILTGPAGRSGLVISAWMIRAGEDIPRFITAYPGEQP